MEITVLEKQGIENIALNEYAPLNGGVPTSKDEASCWSDTITEGPHKIRGKKLSGIISSLVKKGLVWTNSDSVGLTEEGFKVFVETR